MEPLSAFVYFAHAWLVAKGASDDRNRPIAYQRRSKIRLSISCIQGFDGAHCPREQSHKQFVHDGAHQQRGVEKRHGGIECGFSHPAGASPTVWGANALDYYLIDVRRGRWETPELRRLFIELEEFYHPNAVLVEDTELGRAIVQDLRRASHLRPILRRPRFDKEARLLAQAPRFESGQVHLPEDAVWLASYVSELLAFPNGRHDDQVDSTSQALHWLTERNAVSQPLHRRDPERRDVRRRGVETGG